jgi:hypothetical protein
MGALKRLSTKASPPPSFQNQIMFGSLILSVTVLSAFQNVLCEPFLFQDPAKVLIQSEKKHKHRHPRHRRPLKSEKTIADCIREDDRFSKLAKMLEEQSHLNDELENPDNKLTFFAPTNEVRSFVDCEA